MELLKEYVIQFAGLSLGNHTYEFTLNHAFFEHFEASEIQKADIRVALNLEKQERMMVFNFAINGTAEVPCDRCGDEFDISILGDEVLYVKYGTEYEEESEDILLIPPSEHQIDVSKFIYEYIHLLLPYQRLHPEDESGHSACNPEALKKLEELRPASAENERWNVLKNIKLD
ncbi:MAG: DUF177 domain-containing protein [Bacteroidales bacterium]|nr:DUF177 domain-containing protein [Bacteroidales bacterium]